MTARSAQYVNNGDTPTLTGAGFNSPGNATGVTIGGTTISSIAINSNTQITLTISTGDFGGDVIVTDFVGNTTATGGLAMVVDNTAPTVTSATPKTSLKLLGQTTLAGSGFLETASVSPIDKVEINDGSTGVGSFQVNSDVKITLTAGSGNVAYSHINVFDEAGNKSSDQDNAKISIDNTQVTITSIKNAAGDDITVGGPETGFKTVKIASGASNFNLTGVTGDPVVTIAVSYTHLTLPTSDLV